MTRTSAGPVSLDASTLYDDLVLEPGDDSRPHVSMSMVSTADGKATVGGVSRGIGGPLDRTVMRKIRLATDAILHGAATVRGESLFAVISDAEAASREAKGLLPRPLQVILTNTGDVPLSDRARGDRSPLALVVSSQIALRDHATQFAKLADEFDVVESGEESVDLVLLMSTLRRKYGVRRLLLEGGPSVNQAMLEAGLVDEFFLSFSSKIAGGRSTSIVDAPLDPRTDLATLQLISVAPTDDEVFLRYRVVR